MLDGGGDQVPPLVLVKVGNSLQDPVIGFTGPTDKDDFFRETAQQGRHLDAGLTHCGFGVLSQRIIAAGVAEFILEKGPDPLGDLGGNRGSGIVV